MNTRRQVVPPPANELSVTEQAPQTYHFWYFTTIARAERAKKLLTNAIFGSLRLAVLAVPFAVKGEYWPLFAMIILYAFFAGAYLAIRNDLREAHRMAKDKRLFSARESAKSAD